MSKESVYSKDYPGNIMNRRRFISSISAATIGVFAGNACRRNTLEAETAGDISKVAVAKVSTYERAVLRKTIEAMFDNLGGLGDIIKPGDQVGLKVNLTGGSRYASEFQDQTGQHPGETFWTHPEVLRAVGELVTDAGAGRIYVVEALADEASLSQYGFDEITDYLGATFLDLNLTAPYSGYAITPVGDHALIYETLTMNGILKDFDCFISIAKAKRHNSTGVTHGMKNLIGNLPIPAGLYNDGSWNRAAIHQMTGLDGIRNNNLCRLIIDLNLVTPIHLVVNDAIGTVLGGEGPWGRLTPTTFDTLVAGKDPVAADAIATQVLGFDPMAFDMTDPFPNSLNYLKLAGDMGLGNYNLDRIEVVGSALPG